MASRYDQHAQLIEDLYSAGESFTAIARKLQEAHGIPLDASGLRRWLLRRIQKREKQRARLNPVPTASAGISESLQNQAVNTVLQQQEKKEITALDKKSVSTKASSMSDLISQVQAKEEEGLLVRKKQESKKTL